MLRDVKMFAHKLYYETKGKVQITSLSESSSQFKRCSKAVKDNMSLSLLVSGYSDVNVKHVLKVEHSVLSQHMQKAATQVEDGKVKGLFCVLPPGGLEAMCVYGLHTQSLFDASSSKNANANYSDNSDHTDNPSMGPIPAMSYTLHRNKHSKASNNKSTSTSAGAGAGASTGVNYIDHIFPTLFQISWLWADADDGDAAVAGTDTDTVTDAGNAANAGGAGTGTPRGVYIGGDPHEAEKFARASMRAFAKMAVHPLLQHLQHLQHLNR